MIIGNLRYENRVDRIIELAKNNFGYFEFSNKYTYLNSDTCYWLKNEYGIDSAFALKTNNDNSISKLYDELKDTQCKVIPVIEVEKVNLK